MPRYLALEWDSREARLAVARCTGKQIVLEHLFAVELGPRSVGETFADPNVGERIAAALAARRLSKLETLVAVGRTSIELRLLSLPPAPDDELPELVRFQAQRQFNSLADDWPLDYLPLDSSSAGNVGEGGRTVLAAAISSDMVKQIEATCRAADLKAKRLILRPCAAASLVRSHHPESLGEVRLLIDALADEADLTVLVDDTVVFMRTVRLAGERLEDAAKALAAEARRTMVAVQNQLAGRKVERAVLFGRGEEHQKLGAALAEQLGVAVSLFDPLSALELSDEVRSRPPQWPGRYAPLLGMLVDECQKRAPAIDFLHPRKATPPVDPRRKYLPLALVAAIVLLLLVGGIYWQLSSLDGRIAAMKTRLGGYNKPIEQARALAGEYAQLDEWLASDIIWLEEMALLADRLPPANELMVNEFRTNLPSGGGGEIILEGVAIESEVIARTEHQLRDEHRRVIGTGGKQDVRSAPYSWRFEERIVIDRAATEEIIAKAAAAAEGAGTEGQGAQGEGSGAGGQGPGKQSADDSGTKAANASGEANSSEDAQARAASSSNRGGRR